jgi:hypothetical protein
LFGCNRYAITLSKEIKMPKAYEAIRDRLIAAGKSEKAAKRSAAKIYNAQHPNTPLRPETKAKPKR